MNIFKKIRALFLPKISLPPGYKPENFNAVTCPCCNEPMVKRTAKRSPYTGIEFWGCSAYPNCNGIRQITFDGSPETDEQVKNRIALNVIYNRIANAVWDEMSLYDFDPDIGDR